MITLRSLGLEKKPTDVIIEKLLKKLNQFGDMLDEAVRLMSIYETEASEEWSRKTKEQSDYYIKSEEPYQFSGVLPILPFSIVEKENK